MTDNTPGSPPAISLIVPFFNEAEIAGTTVRELIGFLSQMPHSWELLLVDDGSQDNTLDIINAEIAARFPEVRKKINLISYLPNHGRGYALRRGFEMARGEFVITSEFDLSYGLTIINELYQKLKTSHCDVVIASPYLPQGRLVNVPWQRALLSRVGNRILKSAFGGGISTSSGMTRGYKRTALHRLLLTEDGKEIHLEILFKALALGLRIQEIPATLSWSAERAQRARQVRFRPGSLIKSHLLISVMQRPFLLLGTLTLLLLIVGVGTGSYAFIHSLAGEKMGQRPITLFSAMLILFSAQMGCFLFLAKMIQHLQRSVFHLQSQVKEMKS